LPFLVPVVEQCRFDLLHALDADPLWELDRRCGRGDPAPLEMRNFFDEHGRTRVYDEA